LAKEVSAAVQSRGLSTGIASAVKTPGVSVRVEVREGEHILAALRRLNARIRHAYRRQWHKQRPGAYEKPSQRRRRAQRLRRRNARLAQMKVLPRRISATVNVGIGGLYAREHPLPWKRRPFRPWRRWWGA
jgi:ribosomal protein S21